MEGEIHPVGPYIWAHPAPFRNHLVGLLFFVIINNFISKLALRGGFQFAALPGVTIKDFGTKQFIKKTLDFFIF